MDGTPIIIDLHFLLGTAGNLKKWIQVGPYRRFVSASDAFMTCAISLQVLMHPSPKTIKGNFLCLIRTN